MANQPTPARTPPPPAKKPALLGPYENHSFPLRRPTLISEGGTLGGKCTIHGCYGIVRGFQIWVFPKMMVPPNHQF